MPQVIITITADGQSKVEAKGVRGAGCQALTRDIEKALGTTAADTKTAEFHQASAATTRREVQQQ
jgi:hypothetical protein